MHIEIFTVCDSAQSYNDKLVIVGTFNRMISDVFPFTYKQSFSIVGKICYDPEESGEKNYIMSFTDSDGKDVLPPINLNTTVSSNDGIESSVVINIAANPVNFEKPGVYLIKLTSISDSVDWVFKLYLIKAEN